MMDLMVNEGGLIRHEKKRGESSKTEKKKAEKRKRRWGKMGLEKKKLCVLHDILRKKERKKKTNVVGSCIHLICLLSVFKTSVS